MKRFYTLLALAILAASSASPQRITASLGGTVRDPSGSAVPSAGIRITNEGTSATTELKSDGNGRFLAPSLTPGQYDIAITAAGFKQLERKGLALNVDQTATLDFNLEVGSATESIEVTGEAPLLNAASAEIGQVIENEHIVNLPLNQRNPFSLILLAPGVSGSVGSSFTGLSFSVNGGRQGTTDVLLDGISSTPPTDTFNSLSIFPSVDAVQEFKVQTSSYSAEFGLSGGGIINVIYKSGSNDPHGSVYEFLRNSVLDANNFFSNKAGVPLASFKRNQFGFSLGGPIVLPKIYNGRNRSFFFASYEGLRQRSATTTSGTVPTPAERAGDFSQIKTANGAAITIYDPATTTLVGTTYTRQAFPGNIIPASRFDRVASNIIKYWPLPNTTGTNGTQNNNYFASSTAPYNIDQYDIKGDQIVSQTQRFSIRGSQRHPTTAPSIFFPSSIAIAQNAATNTQNGIGAAFSYTWTASPTYLMEFRYGLSRVLYHVSTISDGFDPTQLGFPGYIRDTANALAFPGIAPAGYYGLGAGSQLAQGDLGLMTQTWALAQTKVFSRHTLKFGAEMRLLANNVDQTGRSTGDFSFGSSLTQGPNAQTASSTAGDGFATYLLGLGGGTVTHNFKIIDTISHYWGFYVQDDWKVNNKLTLNLGLRYELLVPRTERHDRETFLDLNSTSPLAGPSGLSNLKGGIAYVGINGNPRSQFEMPLNNISPRVGFAYQALPHAVIRGGIGIFYAPSATEAAATVNQTGYRSDSTFFGSLDGFTPNNTLSDPFPNAAFVPVTENKLGLLTAVGTGITAPQRYAPTPYSENWNFGVQYQFPHNWLLDASYVGTHGVDLLYGQSLNQLPAGDLALGSQLLQNVRNPFFGLISTGPLASAMVQYRYLLAPYPQFTGVSVGAFPGATSSYHSLQLRGEKRFSDGLTLTLSYTFSKMMDDSSSQNGNFNGSGTAQDANNRRGDWSLSTLDVSQRFVSSFVYSLPFGHKQRFGASWNRFVDAALGGWQANGIVTLQTGNPLALSASNVANIFNPGERPNNNGTSGKLTGPAQARLNQWFKTSVFTQPANYTFGNVSRTLPDVRGPGINNVDLSLFKNFRILEHLALEFRAESFNAFNRVQFGTPNTSVTASTFGVITTQANSPRQNQFGLKLLF